MGLCSILRVCLVVFFVALHFTTDSPKRVSQADEGRRCSCIFMCNALNGNPRSFQTFTRTPLERVTEDTYLRFEYTEYSLLQRSGYWAACLRYFDELTASSARNRQQSEVLHRYQSASYISAMFATSDHSGEKGLKGFCLGRICLVFTVSFSHSVTHERLLLVQYCWLVESSRFQCLHVALVQHHIPSQRRHETVCKQEAAGGNTCGKVVSSLTSREKHVTDIPVYIALPFTRHPNLSVSVSRAFVGFETILRNRTIPVWEHGADERINKSTDVTEMPDDKDFPYPCSCPLFVPSKVSDHQCHGQNYTSSTATPCLNTKLYILIITFLSVCLRILVLRDEGERKDGNTAIVLRLFTKSFFLKWHWTRQQHQCSAFTKRCPRTKGNDEMHFDSPFKQNSLLGTLKDYIFRPWLWKTHQRGTKHCASPPGTSGCYSSDSRLCLSCRARIHNFRKLGPQAVQVAPVTRFLPDATRNPDIDLAHVGYRLATLSALPPSVPVSRIKLADAGFYFRGQNDEVTCYSCNLRHSGWTREDNPMEIHRQLSPQCEHVIQRDREQSAFASLGGGVVGGSGSPGSRPHRGSSLQNGASVAVNNHAEGGDGSHETPRQLSSAPREPASSHQGVSAGTVTSDSAGRASEDRHRGISPAALTSTSNRTGTNSSTSAAVRPARNDTSGHSPSASSTSGARANGSGATASAGGSRPPATVNSSSEASDSSARTGRGGSNSNSAEPRHLFPRAGLDLGGAVYPMYQDMASRRRTFTHWDDSQGPPLDHVILCGMFYAGYADCVRCFYCGVGLKHWVATDDVWTEHVRWRPECEYLRAVKGDHFIRETQMRLGMRNTPGEHNSSQAESERQQPVTTSVTASTAVSTTQRAVSTSATVATMSVQQSAPASSASAAPTVSSGVTSSQTVTTRSTPATQVSHTSSTTTATTGSVGHAAATMSLPGGTAAASPSSAISNSNGQGDGDDSNQGGTGVTAVSSAAEDGERLERLQAENRELSRRFQCRVCRQAAIDTILMPCGHLVVCETCARAVTSCPLCHDTIRATARVHMG